MKIALVDDEVIQLKRIHELLSAELQTKLSQTPHWIDSYRSGQSFLDHWTAGQYDVIILDIFMGGITGVEVAKVIRHTDMNVKLVFCSPSNEFATESYEVTAQYYLLKPATQGSITNMLQRLNLELIQLQQDARVAFIQRVGALHAAADLCLRLGANKNIKWIKFL